MSPPRPESLTGRAPGARPDLLAGQEFPPPPQQARSRKKRDALLQAALALFAERGYEESAVEEIAHRAGVAVGGFYQHFASKRQILLALMDRLLEEVSSLALHIGPADLLDAQALIAQMVRQGLQVDWAYAGAYRAWHELAVQDRELRALHQQIEQWTAHLLEQLFGALLQLPGARRDVDVGTLAWVISLLFLRLAETPLTDVNAVDTAVASLTQLIYHALFTDQTS